MFENKRTSNDLQLYYWKNHTYWTV